MRKASSFLTEDKFWSIIDAAAIGGNNMEEQDDLLFAALEKLSIDELVAFKYYLIKFEVKAYKESLWEAAYLVKGGCADDGFEYFRYWLISRGKTVYYNALKDPDSLVEAYKSSDPAYDYEYEGLANIPIEVLEEKYEIDFYEIDGTYDFGEVYDYPEINLEWHEDHVKESLSNTWAFVNGATNS